MTSSDDSLYDRLGGREGVRAVVETFYDRVLADDAVNHYFEGMEMDALRDHQTAFLAMVTGGPADYSGQEMRAAHEGLALDESDFTAIVGHLDASLAAHGVAEADREAVIEEVGALKPAILAD